MTEPFENGITTREESYWFGFLLGDASIAKDRNRMVVVLQNDDFYHLIKLKNFYRNRGNFAFVDNENRYIKYQLEDVQLYEYLTNVGLKPMKTYLATEKIIPSVYEMDFLRGLLDADGTIYLRLPYAMIKWCGNYDIMHGVKDIMSQYVSIGKIHNDSRNESHSIMIGGRFKAEKVCRLLWNNPPIYLSRKYKKVLELYKYNKMNPR